MQIQLIHLETLVSELKGKGEFIDRYPGAFMVAAGLNGYFPVAIYARRARIPLREYLSEGESSWDMLGTNLSVKLANDEWTSEPERLLLMDTRDFNRLGIGLDGLIEENSPW